MALHEFDEGQVDLIFDQSAETSTARRHIPESIVLQVYAVFGSNGRKNDRS
jgi:hypothetical protein